MMETHSAQYKLYSVLIVDEISLLLSVDCCLFDLDFNYVQIYG